METVTPPSGEFRDAPEKTTDEEITLTREQILAVEDIKIVAVPVPEWGGRVYIKTLMANERDAFEIETVINGVQTLENVRAKFLSHCICDKDGALLFSLGDVDALGKKSAAALARLYGKAAEVNFVSDKDVEDLAKNSERVATSTSS